MAPRHSAVSVADRSFRKSPVLPDSWPAINTTNPLTAREDWPDALLPIAGCIGERSVEVSRALPGAGDPVKGRPLQEVPLIPVFLGGSTPSADRSPMHPASQPEYHMLLLVLIGVALSHMRPETHPESGLPTGPLLVHRERWRCTSGKRPFWRPLPAKNPRL